MQSLAGRKSFLVVCVVMVVTACASTSSPRITSHEEALNKITFDIDVIDENGLIGPADGKRSVAYEFCIPVSKARRKEVLAIDPSVRFFQGSSGRVGCDTGQYLCIGEGGTRDVILRLAHLDYIKKIDPFYGE